MISDDVSKKEFFDSEDAAIAFLNHARTMLIHAAELRAKNFNFFLVASGILILAFTRVDEAPVVRIVAGVGVALSIIFVILDVRTFQLIKDARDDLEKVEPRFGIAIHTVDQVPDPSRGKYGAGRLRLISHTYGFRAVFSIMGLLFFWVLVCGAQYFIRVLPV